MVCNLLDDNVVGAILSPGCAFVTSSKGYFCDLEAFDASFTDRSLEVPLSTSTAEGDFSVRLQAETFKLDLDRETRRALVRFREGVPELWVRLGSTGLQLGLSDHSLWAIFCEDVILDPGGVAEGAWLEANGL